MPDLIELYDRASGPLANHQRLAAFCALVRTATRAGVEFTLDREDLLLRMAQDEDQFPRDASLVTIDSLLHAENAIGLARSPIYRPMMLGIDERYLEAKSAASVPTQDPPVWSLPSTATESILAEWRESQSRIKARWQAALE